MNAPQVFISHASEDKERFVLKFATRLREKAIDAKVDVWEIYPGDSLVQKIFIEGIGKAEAVIIVLSQFSVSKPWVQEEMDVSVVRKIQEGIKLIPVVIDECEIPACLKATAWQRIKDINDYDKEFERIVMSIYGHQEKPPLGQPPAYAKTLLDSVPGLTKADSIVLRLACEKAIENGYSSVDVSTILEQVDAFDIKGKEFADALEVLDHKHYIRLARVIGGPPSSFSVTEYGFEQYARAYIPDYPAITRSVVARLVNNNDYDSSIIAEALNQPMMLVNHILNHLAQKRLIKVYEVGLRVGVHNVTVELRRMLEAG